MGMEVNENNRLQFVRDRPVDKIQQELIATFRRKQKTARDAYHAESNEQSRSLYDLEALCWNEAADEVARAFAKHGV